MMRRNILLLLLLAISTFTQAAQSPIHSVNLAELEQRIGSLEVRLQQAEAIRAVKRLQYSYAHYAELGLWLDLGDIFADKGIAHYPGGDFTGPENLRRFFMQELGRGQLGLADGRVYPHIMIQPVITVAPDGRTAKGRWHVIAMLGGYGDGENGCIEGGSIACHRNFFGSA